MEIKNEILKSLQLETSSKGLVWTSTGEFCFTSSSKGEISHLICRYKDNTSGNLLITLAKLERGLYDCNRESSFIEHSNDFEEANMLFELIKKEHYIAKFDESKNEFEFQLVKA